MDRFVFSSNSWLTNVNNYIFSYGQGGHAHMNAANGNGGTPAIKTSNVVAVNASNMQNSHAQQQ